MFRRKGFGARMVGRAVDFVTSWMSENLDIAGAAAQEADLSEALTVQLEIDARLAGFTREQIEREMGSLPVLVAQARSALAEAIARRGR